MKELELKEIQQIELEILKYFRDVCASNGIRYFISNGTLLGAVKYKGFIPWDDDIDVLMPREDYDRFIQMFRNTDRYVLFSKERCSNFEFPFAKLCDMCTRKEEMSAPSNLALGLDIDIFPLDAWTVSHKQACRSVRRIQTILHRISLAKLSFKKGKNLVRTVIKTVALAVVKCVGTDRYIRKIQRIVQRNTSGKQKRYTGCFVWPIYGDREIHNVDVFEDTVKMSFEGIELFAPAGYDRYLRNLYGDYEKDPLPEKQKTHHLFRAYRL